MNCKGRTIWMVLPIILMVLAGCAAPGAQIPREALKPLPVNTEPKTPEIHFKKLLDAQGKPAGLLFPSEDAFTEARYVNELQEWGRLGAANTAAANKILEILATPTKHWWQFWK